MKFFLILLLVIGSVQSHGTTTTTDSIKLLFAGDVMGHAPQIRGAWRDGGDSCYNYRPVFQYVREYLSSADVAVANLEVTLGGAPYDGYPRFSSPGALAVALKEAGFNVLVMANNHSADRERLGLERSINLLDLLGIARTGTFRDAASRRAEYPLIVEKQGFRLAFLNYTYGTNGLPVEPPNIVNLIDTSVIAGDLKRARELQADYLIACMHWGEEYENRENAAQREMAAFLARGGVDLIVGSHPHVVQPFDRVPTGRGDSIPVIYSLGNFVSNQRDRYRDGGIVLEVNLVKKKGVVRLQSCRYEPFWVYRYPSGGVSLFRLMPVSDYLKDPSQYGMDKESREQLLQFFLDTEALLPGLPYNREQ